MDIGQFRAEYPQYNDMGDMDLARALHAKDYTDVPFNDFAQAFGVTKPSGILSDIGHGLKIGADVAAQDVRELVSRVPVIGSHIVSALDKVDEWTHKGVSSDALMKSDIEAQTAAMSPEQQAAGQKRWDTLGEDSAWRDWRSYTGGLAQSIPEEAVMIFPAMRLARAAQMASLAKSIALDSGAGIAGTAANAAAIKAAGEAAARTALIAGSAIEGSLGGAQSSRQVRDDVMALKESDLKDSTVLKSLMVGGLNFEQARSQLAEDASTKAFFLSGVATGIFGGMGDRVLAKAMAGQVTGGLAARFLKGAAAEGVLEELPQSALQQAAQNLAMQAAVPSTPISKDVAHQALGGLALGALQGGAQTAIFGRAGPVSASALPPPAVPPPITLPQSAGAAVDAINQATGPDLASATDATIAAAVEATRPDVAAQDADFANLLQSETRDLGFRRTDLQLEQRKQAELDAIQRDTNLAVVPGEPAVTPQEAALAQPERAPVLTPEQQIAARPDEIGTKTAIQIAYEKARERRKPSGAANAIPIESADAGGLQRSAGAENAIQGQGVGQGNAQPQEAPGTRPGDNQQPPALTPKTVAGTPVAEQSTEALRAIATSPDTPATTRHAAVAAVQARESALQPPQQEAEYAPSPAEPATIAGQPVEKASNRVLKAALKGKNAGVAQAELARRARNPEPQAGTRVAESRQAPAPSGTGEAGVASGRGPVLPEVTIPDRVNGGQVRGAFNPAFADIQAQGVRDAKEFWNKDRLGASVGRPATKPEGPGLRGSVTNTQWRLAFAQEYNRLFESQSINETAQNAPQAAQPATPAASTAVEAVAKPAPAAPTGKQSLTVAPVETFAGRYGEGMNEVPAKQALAERAKARPELDWKVEPSGLKYPFQVVGYAKAATLLGKPITETADKVLKLAAKAGKPEVKVAAQAEIERRQAQAADLNRFAGEAGWEERGGKLIRSGEGASADEIAAGRAHETGAVVGRTKWVPRREWFQRMRQELGPKGLAGNGEIQLAVDSYLSGKTLGKRAQATIDWMLAEIKSERDAFMAEHDAQAEALATPEDLAAAGLEVTGQEEAIADLIAEAAKVDENAAERATMQFEGDDAGLIQALKEIINGNEESKAVGTGEEARPALALEAATPESLRAQEVAAQREAEAKRKQEAAPPASEFALTGSNRPADQAAAAGQQELAPAKPETVQGERLGKLNEKTVAKLLDKTTSMSAEEKERVDKWMRDQTEQHEKAGQEIADWCLGNSGKFRVK